MSLFKNEAILFMMEFCINFDFVKYCIKILFFLITEFLAPPEILQARGECLAHLALVPASRGPDLDSLFLAFRLVRCSAPVSLSCERE